LTVVVDNFLFGCIAFMCKSLLQNHLIYPVQKVIRTRDQSRQVGMTLAN